MDCLRSFTIGLSQNRTFTNTSTEIKMWGLAGNYHWIAVQQGSSIYTIQGYKRIDLYGIEMMGNVQTTLGPNDAGIVTDYSFSVTIGGLPSLVSGVVNPSNFWGITDTQKTFDLTKYTNKIFFESPYQGCENITFNAISLQGQNGETLNSINVDIALEFKFIYKFDGE